MTAPQPSKRTIPQDREGHNSFLHNLFIATILISRVKPSWLLPGWLALVAIAAWPWAPWRGVAGVLAALSLASDWIILALLPVRGRSWGPVTPSLLALTLLRTAISWLLAQILPPGAGLILFFLTNGILSGLVYYATWVEPFRLDITHQQIQIPKWPENSPLCVLHISDLHFEGYSPREEALEAAVHRLNPDLIFLTGDYLNLSSVHDPNAQAEARALLARLEAPLGIYAITGSPAVDVKGIVPQIFEGLPIHWLPDKAQSISLETGEIWLLGVRCTTNLDRDGA
ncbi:MAG: metallophosphoesterase, partial [Anaerolineae bacterium]